MHPLMVNGKPVGQQSVKRNQTVRELQKLRALVARTKPIGVYRSTCAFVSNAVQPLCHRGQQVSRHSQPVQDQNFRTLSELKNLVRVVVAHP
jgi:negative regulator of sigma E activity